SVTIKNSHKAKLSVSLLLTEEKFGVRPPYGVFLLENGEKVKMENDQDLQLRILELATSIADHKLHISSPLIPVTTFEKCQACPVSNICQQRIISKDLT